VPDEWLMFPPPDRELNAPRHLDGVTKQFTKRAENILGFSIRLHDLHVSHGTWLLNQSVPVHVVAKWLGHNPSVVLKVYAKRSEER
jgi:integrase